MVRVGPGSWQRAASSGATPEGLVDALPLAPRAEETGQLDYVLMTCSAGQATHATDVQANVGVGSQQDTVKSQEMSRLSIQVPLAG